MKIEIVTAEYVQKRTVDSAGVIADFSATPYAIQSGAVRDSKRILNDLNIVPEGAWVFTTEVN